MLVKPSLFPWVRSLSWVSLKQSRLWEIKPLILAYDPQAVMERNGNIQMLVVAWLKRKSFPIPNLAIRAFVQGRLKNLRLLACPISRIILCYSEEIWNILACFLSAVLLESHLAGEQLPSLFGFGYWHSLRLDSSVLEACWGQCGSSAILTVLRRKELTPKLTVIEFKLERPCRIFMHRQIIWLLSSFLMLIFKITLNDFK